MIIKIPFRTPTVNHLYCYTRRGCFMKKEAKELRKEIVKIVDKQPTEEIASLKNKILGVDVAIFERWYNLDGITVKKMDIANREKFLIDSVFEGLGIDDKFVFYQSMRKLHSTTNEHAIITIEVL